MASLKALKLRIKSVKSTQKITKAMKMVAASKLKRAREAAEAASPYANSVAKIIASLAMSSLDFSTNMPILSGTGNNNHHLLIITSSDRGLCGAFNSSLIKSAKTKIAKLESEGKSVKLICVGKKAYDSLKPTYGEKIITHFEGIGRKGVAFNDATAICQVVLDLFEQKEFDVCHVIYNEFQSAISQLVIEQQIIPVPISTEKEELSVMPYEFEPNQEEILIDLLPKNVTVQIYRALLENNASEQGARMTAMDNATRNSGEIIKKLTLIYNRTRQAAITRELVEIISGAEAI